MLRLLWCDCGCFCGADLFERLDCVSTSYEASCLLLLNPHSSHAFFFFSFAFLPLFIKVRNKTQSLVASQAALSHNRHSPTRPCLISVKLNSLVMVRVGAKRERPCMAVLHIAIRSSPLPPPPMTNDPKNDARRQAEQCLSPRQPTAAPSPSERLLCKSQTAATLYANAVLGRLRGWWELLGGVRYGLPDAVRLASAVWDDAVAAAPASSVESVGSTSAAAVDASPKAARAGKTRGRSASVSATPRRSGVLRCVVQLSRSLYGDAAALHIFRAACACVTEVQVSVPVSLLSDEGEKSEAEAQDVGKGQRRRQRRLESDVQLFEQPCHVAVRVARVEHVASSRRRS